MPYYKTNVKHEIDSVELRKKNILLTFESIEKVHTITNIENYDFF